MLTIETTRAALMDEKISFEYLFESQSLAVSFSTLLLNCFIATLIRLGSWSRFEKDASQPKYCTENNKKTKNIKIHYKDKMYRFSGMNLLQL